MNQLTHDSNHDRQAEAVACNNRGTARYAAGDLVNAVLDFSEAIRLEPGYAEAYNNRGTVRRCLDDLRGAVADYTEAIRARPGYAQAHNNRGAVREDTGDAAGALADYDAAIAANPGYAEAYNNRGMLRCAKGELAGAEADCARALALSPGSAELHANRGVVLLTRKEYPAAVAAFDQAIAANERLFWAYLWRGNALFHMGDVAGMHRDHATAFRLDPRRTPLFTVRALLRAMRQGPEAFLAECEALVASPGHHAMLDGIRGVTLLLLNRDAEAARDFERVRELLPEVTPYLDAVIHCVLGYRSKRVGVRRPAACR